LPEAVWFESRRHGVLVALGIIARFRLGGRDISDQLQRRRLLNQSTHTRVANSTVSALRHRPRRWIISVLNKPLIVSAKASSLSPTLSTDDHGFIRAPHPRHPSAPDNTEGGFPTDALVALDEQPACARLCGGRSGRVCSHSTW
jgi:hypothetical protein